MSPKIRILPCRTLFQTPNISPWQVDHVVNKIVIVYGRACWRHLYDNWRVVVVYCKSVNCNPLTPLLLGFVVQLVSTVGKFLTDTAYHVTCCWRLTHLGSAVCRYRSNKRRNRFSQWLSRMCSDSFWDHCENLFRACGHLWWWDLSEEENVRTSGWYEYMWQSCGRTAEWRCIIGNSPCARYCIMLSF